MAQDRDRNAAEPPPAAPVICRHRLRDGVEFAIVIDQEAATGLGGHPPDPISQAYLAGDANLNRPLLELMLELVKPGQVVLDLGAHVGSFALTAAAGGCRVLAVEASPLNAALVRASARENGWQDRLTVVHAAVADHDGELDFASFGPWGHVGSPKTHEPTAPVPARRVDGLLAEAGLDRVDFIKIDVEGSEPAALLGAAGLLLRADAPLILYESNYIGLDYFDRTPRDLRAVLTEFGYRHHYVIRPGRLVAVAADDIQGEVVGEYLASKSPLRTVPGFRVETALRRGELLHMIVENCRSDDRHKVQLGRALADAPADVLTSSEIRDLLRSLQEDASLAVREAVGWYVEPPASAGLVRRLMAAVAGGRAAR